MRRGGVGLTLIALLLAAGPAQGQSQPPSEKFLVTARSAFTWSKAGTDIIQLEGPVTISLDRATLSAQQALIWLMPAPEGAPGQQHAEIVLLGDAVLKQSVGTRTGPELPVTVEISGNPVITAEQRTARDMSTSALYARAERIRERTFAANSPELSAPGRAALTRPGPGTRPGAAATQPAKPIQPVIFTAGEFRSGESEEGKYVAILTGGVNLFQRQENGDTLELQAQRVVLFTTLDSLKQAAKEIDQHQLRNAITAAYLEGDARVIYTPVKPTEGEQRLLADRLYYEFTTDRAVLVNAVVHTVQPQQDMPFIARAKILRQLSHEEFNAKNVELTSSAFAVPSYSIAADKLYVRTEQTGDPEFPQRTTFDAQNATFQMFDIPFFWLPFASGSVGDRPGAMRSIGFEDRTNFGFSMLSQWGLFETLGATPPRDLDAAYRVDYFSDRGPGFGLNADYGGGFLTEPDRQPWNFAGNLKSYFVYDKGEDQFGRLPVKPDGSGYDLRGRVLFEHQHFFPNDWQAQLRLGWVSDPTFLENWFPRDFYQDGPEDVMAYIKRQRDTEAFTLLAQAQPNRLVTDSDLMQEQFEVEHLPEAGYHRIGDSLAGDDLTLFSDNTAGGLRFQTTRATLREQGFAPPTIAPGIPSLGTTGISKDTTWRGDFRQEIDWPLHTTHLNIVPYVIGRFTEYSNSPSGSDESRLFAAAGTRMTTAFWKTDPSVQSDLLDIHQMRHVIEPELNLFTSATSVDRNHVFIYEEGVDAINDVSATEVGLRQRWETRRGGPGRWRNVDVFTLDIDAEWYANKPPRSVLNPYDFRGMFFSTLPEASIPRDAVNADASWRLSDNTVLLADAQYNLDAKKLSTAAVGILVRRDIQWSLYLGNRYISDLNSNITTIAATYEISPKYTIALGQSFDFGLDKNVSSNISIVRKFDRFIIVVRADRDQISGQTGFSFNFYPIGFGQGFATSSAAGPFNR